MPIPMRYQDATITGQITDSWNPTNYEVAADFLRHLNQYMAQGKAPLFAGNPGTGKTYAAAAIVNKIEAFRATTNLPALDIVWAPVGETLDRVTFLRDHRRTEDYQELHGSLLNASLVVFDDFAHLQNYDRLRELFWIYVNGRYDRALPTIFTANLDMRDGWHTVDGIFGVPFRRRVQAMCEGLTAVT